MKGFLFNGKDENTTYGSFSGAAAGKAGTSGLVPAPRAGDQASFLRGDGQWAPAENTTYDPFSGAAAGKAGTAGLVPAPKAGDQASFLRGDGQWATAENTTYDPFSGAAAGKAGTAGLVPAPKAGDQASFLRGDGRWTRAETPTYTKDAQGQVTKIDFGNGLRLVKATAEGLSNGWYIEAAGGNILWAGDVGASRPCLLPGQEGETYLGYTNYLWRAVYAVEGSIQTSDRAEKTDIHYLTDPVAAISDPHSEDSPDYDGSPAAADEITYADIEDFVRNLSAATFVYKSGVKDGEVEPAAVQLGLIADDICDHKLYPYIGVTEETESGTKRGLQPIPLAVAALAMCKRQAEQIDELTDRIAKLEAEK